VSSRARAIYDVFNVFNVSRWIRFPRSLLTNSCQTAKHAFARATLEAFHNQLRLPTAETLTTEHPFQTLAEHPDRSTSTPTQPFQNVWLSIRTDRNRSTPHPAFPNVGLSIGQIEIDPPPYPAL